MNLVEMCSIIVYTFSSEKRALREFEVLLYEQACRFLERMLKEELKNERGDYS